MQGFEFRRTDLVLRDSAHLQLAQFRLHHVPAFRPLRLPLYQTIKNPFDLLNEFGNQLLTGRQAAPSNTKFWGHLIEPFQRLSF